jgi:hypothetical protein
VAISLVVVLMALSKVILQLQTSHIAIP